LVDKLRMTLELSDSDMASTSFGATSTAFHGIMFSGAVEGIVRRHGSRTVGLV